MFVLLKVGLCIVITMTMTMIMIMIMIYLDCPSLTQLTIGNANHHVLEEFFSYNFFHADKLQLSRMKPYPTITS